MNKWTTKKQVASSQSTAIFNPITIQWYRGILTPSKIFTKKNEPGLYCVLFIWDVFQDHFEPQNPQALPFWTGRTLQKVPRIRNISRVEEMTAAFFWATMMNWWKWNKNGTKFGIDRITNEKRSKTTIVWSIWDIITQSAKSTLPKSRNYALLRH